MPRGMIHDNMRSFWNATHIATTLYRILDDLHKRDAPSCQHGEMPEVSNRRLRRVLFPRGTLALGNGNWETACACQVRADMLQGHQVEREYTEYRDVSRHRCRGNHSPLQSVMQR
jgi:hypothetical protein